MDDRAKLEALAACPFEDLREALSFNIDSLFALMEKRIEEGILPDPPESPSHFKIVRTIQP